MASRNVCLFSMVCGLLAFACAAPAFAGENSPETWDRTRAAQYLDQRGEQWFNFGSSHRGEGESQSSCISCHSLLSYALARPVLRQLSNEPRPTKWETKLLEQTRRRVANWDKLDTPEFQLMYDFDADKKKQSRGTEAILNLLVLALDDRARGRQDASADTKRARAILWETQLCEGANKGSWEWLNFGLDPWETDKARYMGASIAAIALGSVPGVNPGTTGGDLHPGLLPLRYYLTKQYPSQNLHNRVWLLWASTSIDGLLEPEEKGRLIKQIVAKQQESGGWSLGSLGQFARKDVKQDTNPDGYATGLIVHVLQLAGKSKDDAAVAKGLAWLKANQDPTGAWRTASLNKNRAPSRRTRARPTSEGSCGMPRPPIRCWL